MGNIIVGLILIAIIALATLKVVADKKNGVKCAGCPHAPKGIKKGQEMTCSCQDVTQFKL